MNLSFFQKTILSFLIAAILFLPLAEIAGIKKAEAIDTSSIASGIVGGGLACAAGSGISAGINALKTIFTPKVKAEEKKDPEVVKTTAAVEALDRTINGIETSSAAKAVPVDSLSLNAWARTIEAKQASTSAEQKAAESQTAWQVIQQRCITVMEKAIAKALLAELTKKIVNWINSGFNGNPFYIQDQQSFFHDIAKKEINSFVAVIGFDGKNFPFGRDSARQLLRDAQTNFEARSQYNLPQVIGTTNAEHFSTDFTAGGWAGWMGVTQSSANNPIGFNYQVSNELAKTLRGTYSSPAEKVQHDLFTGNGFLSMDLCDNPTDYESPSKDTSFSLSSATAAANAQCTIYTSNCTDLLNHGVAAKEWLRKHQCVTWKTVTPGHYIATQLDTAGSAKIGQYINATDINTALSGIFDALFNQAFKKGIASLGGSGDSTGGGNAGDGSFIDLGNTTVTNSNTNSNTSFNIKTDLEGIINTQVSYKQALQSEVTALQNQIASEKKLDLCIPGPTAEWRDGVSLKVEEVKNDWTLWEANNGTLSASQIASHFQSEVSSVTGYAPANVINASTATDYLNGLYEKYSSNFDSIYSPAALSPALPSISLSETEIAKQSQNQATIDDLNDQINNTVNQNIIKLTLIKQQVDATTNAALLAAYKGQYDALSYTLATSDDISTAQSNVSSTNTNVQYSNFLVEQCISTTKSINYAGPLGRMEYPNMNPIYTYANGITYTIPYTYSVYQPAQTTFYAGTLLPDVFTGSGTYPADWSYFEKYFALY